MVGVIRRYRIAFIVAAALILLTAAWFIIFKGNANKIPMRGVFVINPFVEQLL